MVFHCLWCSLQNEGDTNPRYRYENVMCMALDMPEKTTQAFTAVDMRLSVDAVLRMSLNDDSAYEEVQFLPADSRSYPSKILPQQDYLHVV